MLYTFSQLELLGRLGNQLWQIASTIGLARSEGGKAVFRPDWEYRPYFSLPDEYFAKVPPGRADVDRKNEFLQELKFWWFMREEILELFAPGAHLLPELDRRWLQASGGAHHTTSIHIRRGDYTLVPNRFPACSPHYYMTAMEMVLDENPNTRFIVFSDDITFCKKNLFKNVEADMVFVDGISRPVEVKHRKHSEPEDYWDLFMMARCDEHIIANSSYSWWGAILAGNMEAIYPDRWYGPELKDINWEPEMILDSWRKVQC